MRRMSPVALACLAGCYSAIFDEDASGRYACQADDDCPDGQACVLDVCEADDGPHLEIRGPEPLQVFPAETLSFDLDLVDKGDAPFVLGPPGQGDGHVKIWVDRDEIDPIVEGDLKAGIVLSNIVLPPLPGGVHRIRAIAVDPDGDPLPGPSAAADRVFFVDRVGDEAPQIAIVEPFPQWPKAPIVARDKFEVGQPLRVVIGGNGFQWTDPGGDDAANLGHTHVYLLPNYPDCLPECNSSYVASLKPATNTTEDERLVDGVAEAMIPPQPTRLPVSAGLQWGNHVPYPAASLMPADWGPAIHALLVNDAVEIEFFAPE